MLGEGEEVVDREAAEETDMLNGGGCNLMQSVVFLTWICVAVSRHSLQLRALMPVFFFFLCVATRPIILLLSANVCLSSIFFSF